MPEFKEVLYAVVDASATITLNRPEKRNALGRTILSELKSALLEAESDVGVRVIALRGAGKDFCAGADLAQLERVAQGDVLENLADASEIAGLFLLIRKLKKPVVAAVHGRALAGGAGLASACDLVLATRSASFCYTEVKLGFVPAIVAAIARRNLSEKRAFEILCSGKAFSAEEAERIGFINRVFDDDQFDAQVRQYVREMAGLSGSAVALTKSLLYQIDAMSFQQAVTSGVDVNTIARMTPDCIEGVRKFLSKE
jgi:methylglutaconyl-CoA hydratase